MRRCLSVLLFFSAFGTAQTPATKAAPSYASPADHAGAVLDDALKDKNPDTRKHAVQALGLITPADPHFLQLEAMLADKDVEVKLATVTSLADLKSKRTIPVLQAALDNDVPEVRFAAAKALWGLSDPSGRQALVAILAGEGKTSSGFITRQKRDMVRMLHTPKTLFMFAVQQGAGLAPVPGLGAGISSLQGILADSGTSGRAATALLLGTDKSPEVQTALLDALSDTDWTVRAAAAHSIALRNDPALKANLLPLMDDKKEAVRVRAAAGYLRLNSIRPPAPPRRKQAPAAKKQ